MIFIGAKKSFVLQEFVHSSLAPLLDSHVFFDTEGHIGQVVLELGHADTLALRASRGQATADQSLLPASNGSLLHCILTNPDNVSLEFLTPEVFAVSEPIQYFLCIRYKWQS
jgi:hypothetical protein